MNNGTILDGFQETCNACHDNAALFLTADKVKPSELDANRSIIVDKVTPKMGQWVVFSLENARW